ncbi:MULTISPECIES: 3-hydroxybutyrate oligomer hydrolase family protein [unclassified Janthinobacterium]|uniref:3-hydroxybutyrate oligomer hydrolase family protein n=1 Tax=unclassified Janthinobacterium TaxID=2610881 RepID=UPI00160FB0D1|nr:MULTISPECIES: 3-hydroxybutyrate oligomer hydrolase family protein [unclassified Janthinobacterium]MBB5370116.1 hydroxybutyrate-dimer hydrolase [Janthinobacterium sp. K2C7]MBB5382922.1 hydroxybutyrate-dimer hydrolase [Janthinobacterium sp. K2Li3]MBB5388599.1 hydroxybutyrate-dimer hydrolase [Janthinobacterium sp. K2E3]
MQKTLTLAGLCTLLAACGSNHAPEQLNQMPSYLGTITRTDYDGKSNDLLTAGLGKTGLAAGTPAYVDPEQPTAPELRRNAIYSNYRAVLDISINSGYGSLYGPNVDAQGKAGSGEGLIAGSEYLAYADDGTGRKNVTLMVQIPNSFDPQRACIVTGTSSGSRGIYGAIGSSGEWGLKNGCAVAYADKGSGTGLYVFEDDSVNLQNGLRAGRVAAGKQANFAPDLSDADRSAFASAYPNRVAFKHAHSQQNPEQDWGKVTLQAVEMAYYVLNERYGALAHDGGGHTVRLHPRNTITIASSISNGGGSALLAAEQDSKGLISGVAVSEPQVQPGPSTAYSVRQGGVPVATPGRALFDYATYAALYQPCIASVAGASGRCTALVAKGLLTGADLVAQQNDAKRRLQAYGWLIDSDPLQAAHAGTNILVAVTYVYAYGKFSVTDQICGFNFAQTDGTGNPAAFSSPQKAASFAAQNGILGNVLYEKSIGGARVYTAGVSPSSNLADQSLDGFLCLRSLATGVDAVNGARLEGSLAGQSARVRAGMAEVQASGKLGGKPAIIVHGRSDTLIPVNHASRAYVGWNAVAEGANSQLRYIEVTNANHFDSFSNTLPTLIVPLHVYFNRALDAMYGHLRSGLSLPPSQVVRTVTRPYANTLITTTNVPPISAAPTLGNVIRVTATVVDIPN